jgi:cysteinyl-tRNA synthetase
LEEGKADAAGVADLRQGAVVLKELAQILGIFLEPSPKSTGEDDRLVAGLMQLFIDLRADARKAKNFALADQIRQRLSQLGITLEDRPGGTDWRRG